MSFAWSTNYLLASDYAHVNHGTTAEKLIDTADQELYVAKHVGRYRVCFFHSNSGAVINA